MPFDTISLLTQRKQNKMFNFKVEILENGNLALSLPDADDREEVQDMISDHRGYWYIMNELFEQYSTNGSFTHFDASEANPFVGLTSAPCIAEAMDVLDDGSQKIEGRFWFFSKYVTEMETELLAAGETVEYTYFQVDGDQD